MADHLTFMGFALLALVIGAVLLSFEDKIIKKLESIFKMRFKKGNCKGMKCYTYEGLTWVLLMYLIILPIVLYYPVAVVDQNLPCYFGFVFICMYPPIIMLLRRDTFNDNSIPSSRNPISFGSNLVNDGPGYNPVYYLLFSFLIGGSCTLWAFSQLNFLNHPLSIEVSRIIVGIIGQTVILFPDKINKISPVDTRTRKGLSFMIGVTVVIIICEFILSYLLYSI